jgi:hypothetical protein
VRESVRDRSKSHDDEAGRGVGGMKAAGPVDDESHAPTESLMARNVHGDTNRGEYSLATLANDLGRHDVRLEPDA